MSRDHVESWMRELGRPLDDALPLPPAEQLWLRAEMIRRLETQRRIDTAFSFAWATANAGALAVLVLSLDWALPALAAWF